MEANERLGCLGFFSKLHEVLLGGRSDDISGKVNELPYRRKEWLLTRAERSFFGVLQKCVGDEYLIFSMVRLADVVYIAKGTNSRRAALNRIQSKHIDFLLCERGTVKPVLAVELDDSSHSRSDRRERDRFVDSVFAAAELPLLRVCVKSAYDPVGIRKAVLIKMGVEPSVPVGKR